MEGLVCDQEVHGSWEDFFLGRVCLDVVLLRPVALHVWWVPRAFVLRAPWCILHVECSWLNIYEEC